MKKLTLSALLTVCLPEMALAHTPLFSCYDDGDNTVLCEGGFSNGASAAGVEILVVDEAGGKLIKSELNEDSEITFKKPTVDYKVKFNAGPGHSIELAGKEIVE